MESGSEQATGQRGHHRGRGLARNGSLARRHATARCVHVEHDAPLSHETLSGDITSSATSDAVIAAMKDQRAELVVCDGAPDVTGLHDMYLLAFLIWCRLVSLSALCCAVLCIVLCILVVAVCCGVWCVCVCLCVFVCVTSVDVDNVVDGAVALAVLLSLLFCALLLLSLGWIASQCQRFQGRIRASAAGACCPQHCHRLAPAWCVGDSRGGVGGVGWGGVGWVDGWSGVGRSARAC